MTKGTLYLLPTPLSGNNIAGNTVATTLPIIVKLKYFIVEDRRTAIRYLSKIDMETTLDDLQISLLNEHTAATEIKALLQPLLDGNDVGLLSDAGLPCVADPGEELVQLAHCADIKVSPLSGASSIMLAIAASGLQGEKFAFEGYLPAKTQELAGKLRQLEQSSRQERQSKIFIEAPYRNLRMFETILNTCRAATWLCVACNLTAPDEYVKTRQIGDWKKLPAPDLHKKPCIFIIMCY
jgi:16S rRNA (cytidine1402-2'-O)-methyltransferase